MPRVVFKKTGYNPITVEAKVGESVYYAAERHGIDLDGACGCVMACSRCYVVIEPEWYENMALPCDDEEDLLYISQSESHTKRLSCQIIMTEELDGIIINLDDKICNIEESLLSKI